MADEKYTFDQARVRLEEIVAQVRRKDVSLETSIDLLEEGVRLANLCTELSDHTEWRAVAEEQNAAAAATETGVAEGGTAVGPDAEEAAQVPAETAERPADGELDQPSESASPEDAEE